MEDQKLDQVEPIRVGDKLLYPVDSKISEIFENGNSTAQLIIKDNHFVIWGPRLQQDLEHKDHPIKESLIE